MEEEEDLDKETVGRKVSTSNIGPIYIIQNFYVIIIYLIGQCNFDLLLWDAKTSSFNPKLQSHEVPNPKQPYLQSL